MTGRTHYCCLAEFFRNQQDILLWWSHHAATIVSYDSRCKPKQYCNAWSKHHHPLKLSHAYTSSPGKTWPKCFYIHRLLNTRHTNEFNCLLSEG